MQRTNLADTDFQSQISATLALKPDLIVLSLQGVDGGNLVRQLRELGYKGTIVVGNGMNTPNIYPICQNYCDGLVIAQAYTALQVVAEALQRLDRRKPLKTLSVAETRKALMDEILGGTYQTPLGEIHFTPEGEVIQKNFFVAQVRMNPDGRSGRFALLP